MRLAKAILARIPRHALLLLLLRPLRDPAQAHRSRKRPSHAALVPQRPAPKALPRPSTIRRRMQRSPSPGPPAPTAKEGFVTRTALSLQAFKPFSSSHARPCSALASMATAAILPLPLAIIVFFAALAAASAVPVDPRQLLALRALGLGARRDPCGAAPPGSMNASCDASLPFRRVTSLSLTNCSATTSVSTAALDALAPSLRSLSFSDCPAAPPRALPPDELAANLLSFTCTASLRRLSAVWLSRLANLTELTVADTPLAATGSPTELAVVVSHMDRLTRLTVSNANLSGLLPHHWHCPNLTRLDLSANRIAGPIPDTLTLLAGITHLNLSSNVLTGAIPTSIGDLISLTTLDLSRNTLSGGVPDTVSTLPELEVLDLGSNRLNGSIPLFLTEMRGLRELNLENNDFDGVVPFGPKFLSRLRVFRAAGNAKLCYNRSVLAAEMAVGVAPCDKYGFPVLPPPATAQSERNADYDDGYRDPADAGGDARGGPSVAVLGVAIGLSCLAFLVILFVCICKVCR